MTSYTRQSNEKFSFAAVDAFHKSLGGLSSSWVGGLVFFIFYDATGIAFCKAVLLYKCTSTITIVSLFSYFTSVEWHLLWEC